MKMLLVIVLCISNHKNINGSALSCAEIIAETALDEIFYDTITLVTSTNNFIQKNSDDTIQERQGVCVCV